MSGMSKSYSIFWCSGSDRHRTHTNQLRTRCQTQCQGKTKDVTSFYGQVLQVHNTTQHNTTQCSRFCALRLGLQTFVKWIVNCMTALPTTTCSCGSLFVCLA